MFTEGTDMALLLEERYRLTAGVINHEAVLSHLESVLKAFATKPEYSEFYIGITGNLERRRREHQSEKPTYKLMCPIYSEQSIVLADSFHNLESAAINRFSQGIRHPETGQVLLRCENSARGSQAKNWLYLLVG